MTFSSGSASTVNVGPMIEVNNSKLLAQHVFSDCNVGQPKVILSRVKGKLKQ